MPEKIGAVITGGDFQALGVLRTLARKNIPTIVVDHDHCISRYSKFKKKFFRSPHPSDTESFVHFLIRLAKQEGIHGWVVFPNDDETVRVLSQHKQTLEEFYRIPTPPWNVIQEVYIKKNTYQLAEKHGIPVPKTYYPRSMNELMELDLQFPLLIKPSIGAPFYKKFRVKAIKVRHRDELIRIYQAVCTFMAPSDVLIQEIIPGGPSHLYSFCPFFKHGKAFAHIAARRARQLPMDFGQSSTFAEVVDIPAIKKLSEQFLGLIDYYGLAEVEFMHDPRDGQYKMLEVNPRVWGWHTLAIGAGVDLPYLLYLDAIGHVIEAQHSQNHHKWVRLATDIPTACVEIVNGHMTFTDYVHSMNGKKEFAVFSVNDPIPFLAELLMMPYRWKKRPFRVSL